MLDPARLTSRLKGKHLTLVQSLSQTCNLRLTADLLSMSPSAASKLLADLEDAVGATLFTRTSRGLSPTASGEALLRWSRLMLADISAVCGELQAIRVGSSGRLRLGTFPVATAMWVPRLIAALLELDPGLLVNVREGREDVLVTALRHGELDCVIGRLVPAAAAPELHYDFVAHEDTAVVVGNQHPLARQARFDPRHLAQYGWVLPAEASKVHGLVTAWLGGFGLPPPHLAVESTSILSVVSLLGQVPLLSALPEPVARYFERLGAAKCLGRMPPGDSNPVVLMYRTAQAANPKLVLIREALAGLREAGME